MRQIVGYGWDYFCQIKSVHNELHAEAVLRLGHRRPSRAHGSITDSQSGQVVTYHVWRHDLTEHGWLDWTHARPLVRIRRTAYNPTTGETSKGNRYYVTSLPPDRLSPDQALALSRAHRRCEDEVHWTAGALEGRRHLTGPVTGRSVIKPGSTGAES